jgi:hypothetical protein
VTETRYRKVFIFLLLLIGGSASLSYGQPLDETWTISVGAETVEVSPDGSFTLPNISAPDDFGPNGPGTRPDFLSDDYVRLTGYSTASGETVYVWTEPFRLKQGEPIYIFDSDLTFSTTPPPVPISLLAVPDAITLTSIAETTQVHVTAFLADGTEKDASNASEYTTYRTSNVNMANVSGDGLVTAKAEGKVFITAINEGVTSVTQINIAPGASLTQIVGVVTRPDGSPVVDADVVLAGLNLTTTTNASGAFFINSVPISDIFAIDAITVQSVSENGSFFGSTTSPELVAGGVTDAGLIQLMDLCDELGEIACIDSDNDCLPDVIEIALGLDPNNPDSDGNTIPDGEEDPDLDGLTNCAEVFLGTDPELEDSDNDGLTDGEEVFILDTNPRNPDTDFDGLLDGEELFPSAGFDATDPFRSDSDFDGVDDGLERAEGTDPLDANSRPPLRFYSSKVSFLNALEGPAGSSGVGLLRSRSVTYYNALTGDVLGSGVEIPETDRIASRSISYYNAIYDANIHAPGDYTGALYAQSGVVSYDNQIAPGIDVEGSVKAFSQVVSYLNADPNEGTVTRADDSILLHSRVVSYYNLLQPENADHAEILKIASTTVSYYNFPDAASPSDANQTTTIKTYSRVVSFFNQP